MEGLFEGFVEEPAAAADPVAAQGARLGLDPGNVRVHTDGDAAEKAEALGARAFTQGGDIGFARGAYAPDTDEGQHLIAHELTHVAQQAQGAPATQLKAAGPASHDPAEVEADEAADALVAGAGPVGVRRGVAAGEVHRKPDEAPAHAVPGKAALDKGRSELTSGRALLPKLQKLPADLPEGGATTAAELKARIEKVETDLATIAPQIAISASMGLLQWGLGLADAANAGVAAPPELDSLRADALALLTGVPAAIAQVRARVETAKRWEADLERDASKKAEKSKGQKVTAGVDGHAGGKDVSGSASLDDGKVSVDGKVSGKATDEEEHTKTSTTTTAGGHASSSGGGVTGSHETKTTHGYDKAAEEKREKEQEEFELKKARGEVPKDAKFEGSEPEKKYSSDSHKTSGGVSFEDGKTTVEAGHEKTHTNTDGTSTTAGATGSVTTDAHGNVTVKGGAEVAAKGADGKATAQGGGSVAVSKDGVVVTAHGGTDKVDVGGSVTYKEGEKGVKGHVKIGGDEKSFTVGGGRTVKFSPVAELPGGKFAVTCTVTNDLSVGGGVGTPKGSTGASVGASIGTSDTMSMTKIFDTAEAADAYRKAENVPGGQITLPRDPAAARSLKPGESVEEGHTGSIGVTAGAKTGGVSVGVSAGSSDTNAKRIERKEGNVVAATQTIRMDANGGITLGNVVSAGVSSDKYTLRSLTVEVDLGPADAPNTAAEEAYRMFLATGRVVPPAKETSHSDEQGHGTSVDIGVAGVHVGTRKDVRENRTVDKNGVTDTSTGENTASAGISLPFLSDNHMSESNTLRAVDVNGERRGYYVETKIDDSSATDTQRALAEATGTHQDRSKDLDPNTKTSGKWKVESEMSVKGVDKVLEAVKSGKFDPRFLGSDGKAAYGGNAYSAGADFADAIKAAGDDKDAQRKAIARFVADGGEKALQQLRGWGGGDSEYHLTLTTPEGKPDKNFPGVEGRYRMEEKISGLQERVSGATTDDEKRDVALEIKGAMAEVRGRIMSITPERYSDVPPDLLEREVSRNRGDLSKLEGLLAKAKAGMGEKKPEEASGRHHKAPRKSIMETDKEMEARNGPGGGAEPFKETNASRQAGKLALMRDQKARAQEAQRQARNKKNSHWSGAGGSKPTPRKYAEYYETALYAASDQDFQKGTGIMVAAQATENAALSLPDFSEEEMGGTLCLIDIAAGQFDAAASSFNNVATILLGIEQAHPDYF